MKLDELNPKARVRAIDEHRYNFIDYDWWVDTYALATEYLESIGFWDVKIKGHNDYNLDWVGYWGGEATAGEGEHMPEIANLRSVLQQQLALFNTWEPGSCISVRVDTARSINVDVEWFGSDWAVGYPPDELYRTEAIEKAIGEFNDELLRWLADEYEYRTSDEHISLMLEDEEFTEDGDIT